MKLPVLLALLCATVAAASAAETRPGTPIPAGLPPAQTGRMSTVRLLATGRVPAKDSPDGMRFMFLITRVTGATGSPTLKETRDFLLNGSSYQEKTLAELRKKFEPVTEFEKAEKFFDKHPRLLDAADLTPREIAGAYILTLAIGGAPLSAEDRAAVTVQFGWGREVEPFTFEVKVPLR